MFPDGKSRLFLRDRGKNLPEATRFSMLTMAPPAVKDLQSQ
jgi:hypothetical protein